MKSHSSNEDPRHVNSDLVEIVVSHELSPFIYIYALILDQDQVSFVLIVRR